MTYAYFEPEPITVLDDLGERFLDTMGEDAYHDRLNGEVGLATTNAAICLYALESVAQGLVSFDPAQLACLARHSRIALQTASYAANAGESALDTLECMEVDSITAEDPQGVEDVLRKIASITARADKVLRESEHIHRVAKGEAVSDADAAALREEILTVCAALRPAVGQPTLVQT